MASNDTSDDPEISAAFGGAPVASADSSHVSDDPEISAAFKDSKDDKKEEKKGRPGHAAPEPEGTDAITYAGKSIVGAGENILSGITGGAGNLADAVTGSDPGTHDWGYRPRTEAGKEIAEGMSGATNAVGKGIFDKALAPAIKAGGGDVEAARGTLGQYVPEAIGAVGTVAGAGGLLRGLKGAPATTLADTTGTAQEAANAAVAKQNSGAGAVATDVSKLDPATQKALANLHESGGAVDQAALDRVSKAESVGVHLTEGQAKQNSGIMSHEFNNKNMDNNAVGDRFDQQDQALVDKVKELHQEQAPTAVANDEIQNGQAVLDGLKRYDIPKKQAVTDAYNEADAANQAAGKGALKLDTKPAIDHAAKALEDQEELLPSEGQIILKKMKDAADNGTGVPLKQMETWKTIVSRATRKYQSADDGNAVTVLGHLRDAMEEASPTSDAAGGVKAKFDKARGLAKDRFAEQDADPAYKAAVNDETPIGEQSDLSDKFTSKYLHNGSRANVQRIRTKLAGDADAGQAVTSSAFNQLRKAGETSKGFSQDAYNKALSKINSKPELIGDTDTLEKLNTVGEVGGMVQRQSRGTSYNNSHTSLALQKAASIANAGPVHAVAGFLPHGTTAINMLTKAAEKNAAFKSSRSLAPGAGLARTE